MKNFQKLFACQLSSPSKSAETYVNPLSRSYFRILQRQGYRLDDIKFNSSDLLNHKEGAFFLEEISLEVKNQQKYLKKSLLRLEKMCTENFENKLRFSIWKNSILYQFLLSDSKI